MFLVYLITISRGDYFTVETKKARESLDSLAFLLGGLV